MSEVKKIRAAAKILVGLRFKNRCIICGKAIPPDRVICNKCKLKKVIEIKKKQKDFL